ncbi:MAG TPA: PTS system mannose/fructose/sorbose family transporter subunit IID [Longimicrobiales bacterium]|nr:PTS system mannose/fructose/sorbose family transporter subunit IID [Longimicrobiales bacterium]
MKGRATWWVFLRALAVQGAWNYQTYMGTGFAFVLLPALRRLHPDRSSLNAAVRRHEGLFNSHPYLAPLALGAVIRMEEEGEDPAVIERFKVVLRSTLGTLGDQLIWAGWRPLCLLLALALLLLGAPWWAAVGLFLLLYNTGHLALMIWGMRVGLAEGRGVAERLRGSFIRSTQPRLMVAGSFAVGVTLALVVLQGVPTLDTRPGYVWIPLAVAAAAAGARWGERARRVGVAGITILAGVGLVLGALS